MKNSFLGGRIGLAERLLLLSKKEARKQDGKRNAVRWRGRTVQLLDFPEIPDNPEFPIRKEYYLYSSE